MKKLMLSILVLWVSCAYAQESQYPKWLTFGACAKLIFGSWSFVPFNKKIQICTPIITSKSTKNDVYVNSKAEIKNLITHAVYGYIDYWHKVDKSEASIQWLSVSPEYRKKGYGERLVRYALDNLQNAGFDRVTVKAKPLDGTTQDKLDMLPKLISFYEKCGGAVVHRREEDAYMEFILTKSGISK